MAKQKTALSVLVAARELISSPEKWTKGKFARDIKGESVAWHGDAAVCWCSEGAINRAGHDALHSTRYDAYRAIEADLPDGNIVEFNDAPERTHPEVLAAFDRAIAKLKAEQSAS